MTLNRIWWWGSSSAIYYSITPESWRFGVWGVTYLLSLLLGPGNLWCEESPIYCNYSRVLEIWGVRSHLFIVITPGSWKFVVWGVTYLLQLHQGPGNLWCGESPIYCNYSRVLEVSGCEESPIYCHYSRVLEIWGCEESPIYCHYSRVQSDPVG